MTKKKMIICVLVGLFVLYGCAMSANYTSSLSAVCDKADDWWQEVSHAQYLMNFIDAGEKDFSKLHCSLNEVNPTMTTFLDLPYSYIVVDSDKNVILESGSTVWWRGRGDTPDYYIPIEKYMTSEIKAEILDFQNKAFNERITIKEMEIKLNQNSEICIPVSIIFEDAKSNNLKIVFNDLPFDKILLSEEGAFTFVLYDLDEKTVDHRYYLDAQKEVKKEVENYVFRENQGGGGGFCHPSGGQLIHTESFKGYLLVISARYSSFNKTVTSYLFSRLFMETTFLFAVVGLIIMIFALKTFNKNQKLKENQRAFTSAVAHEMKTPLAVIQNQCECIMDGVAPEKNGQYVRSVYDEAQKMNGMVQSFLMFNRLSDMVRLKAERCCLSEIVLSEIGKYESFASAKSVSFNADVAPDVFADGNAELLAIAVGNYLSNAVRYSTGEAEIDIKLEADGKSFTFSVYNNGEPIESSEDIWSVLTRGDASRNGSDSSSGMGLPICKRIFELHKMEYGYAYEENRVKFYFKGKVI